MSTERRLAILAGHQRRNVEESQCDALDTIRRAKAATRRVYRQLKHAEAAVLMANRISAGMGEILPTAADHIEYD